MRMKCKLVMLYCVLIYSIGVDSVLGQNVQDELKEKRISLRTDKVHLGAVLGYLSEVNDVPIGFEESTLDRASSEFRFSTNSPGISYFPTELVNGVLKLRTNSRSKAPLHPITLNAENQRLEDILNVIVKQAEYYKWEVNDGVVNIYPKNGRADRFEQLLNLRIRRFVFEGGSPIWKITTNIKALPEFSAFVGENNLRFTGVRSGPQSALQKMYGRRIEEPMSFSDLTFRELLNRVTKIKRGGWILKWRFVSKKTCEEFIDIDI